MVEAAINAGVHVVLMNAEVDGTVGCPLYQRARRAGLVYTGCDGDQPGDDPAQRHYLHLYTLGEGPLYSFYTPYHLCHFEVPNTVARAVLFGDATLEPLGPPTVEVVATAKTDLAEGHVLDGLGGYDTYGVAERADVTADERLLPMGVAEGCTLRRALRRDDVLTYDDVMLPTGHRVDELRTEMTTRPMASS